MTWRSPPSVVNLTPSLYTSRVDGAPTSSRAITTVTDMVVERSPECPAHKGITGRSAYFRLSAGSGMLRALRGDRNSRSKSRRVGRARGVRRRVHDRQQGRD